MKDNNSKNDLQVDHTVLWDIICGMIGFPAFFVAQELNIFELLSISPLSTKEIAKKLDTDLRATEALISVNASLGLLTKEKELYTTTATAEMYLLKTSPSYMGGFLDMLINNHQTLSIESLRKAVKTGKSQAYDGNDIFESHSIQEEQARYFTHAMHGISVAPAEHWPNKIDLSNTHKMLDIGGGSGAHSFGALRKWPNLHAQILDLYPVCNVALKNAASNNLQERFSSHVGDLWKDPFPSADLHFYSQIFHDWPEEKCQFLTDKSFNSLEAGGRIVLHEMLYSDNKLGPFSAAASSIGMLLWTEGKQYSGKELSKILMSSGFTNIEIIPTFSYWSVVTAVKPG